MRGNSMKSLGLLFIGSGFATMAGAWGMTFGEPGYNDAGYAVQQTADGGYVIAGSTASFGASGLDAWLVKTDASGKEQWSKTFGGPADDIAYAVRWTADGGYVLAGTTRSYGAGREDAWLIKTDANGVMQWNRTFGGSADDYGYAAQQTSDGGYILAGTTRSFGFEGTYDAWLIKTDANGKEQWYKPLGGPNYDYGYAVQQTADGGYVITGHSSMDPWLIKTDASGVPQWSKTFGGQNPILGGYGYAVQQTADGGYVIAGTNDSYNLYGPFGDIDGAIWLLKTDASGDEQWEKTFDSPGHGSSVQQTADGGYVIAGTKVSKVSDSAGNTASNLDAVLIKTDANGNKQWDKTFSRPFDDYGYAVQQTSDGGYVLAGSTNSLSGGYFDVLLLKADANGDW